MKKDGDFVRKIKILNLIIVAIFIITNIIFTNECYGKINPNDYNPDSSSTITTDDTKLIFNKTRVILGAIRNISAVVSVIALMVIGLKYIIGSAEEKANDKQTMIPYIIGCIMAVAGTTIVSFIYNAIH